MKNITVKLDFIHLLYGVYVADQKGYWSRILILRLNEMCSIGETKTSADFTVCPVCNYSCQGTCSERCIYCNETTRLKNMRDCHYCEMSVCVHCLYIEEKGWKIPECCDYKLVCPRCEDRHLESECDMCHRQYCYDFLEACFCGMECCPECFEQDHKCRYC